MGSDASGADEVVGPKVFISYRRSDTEDIAERLSSLLMSDLGSRNVYRDRESMILGEPWREALRDAMRAADAALFLVGPGWEGESASGRRIDETDDPVRREAEAALSADVRANPLPLLIDRTAQPEGLSDDIKGLFDVPNFMSMSRGEVTSESSTGYQSILVGIWAALARLVPHGVIILGESSKMVELDSLVEELTATGALDSQTLSRFASGVYIASWRDVKKIQSDFPQLIVQSTGDPSEILKARLAAFATLSTGAAVAATGAGAAALVAMGPSLGFGGSTGAATLVQTSSAQLVAAAPSASTASAGGFSGMWASAGVGAKVATAAAGVALVAGGAAVVLSAINEDDAADAAFAENTQLSALRANENDYPLGEPDDVRVLLTNPRPATEEETLDLFRNFPGGEAEVRSVEVVYDDNAINLPDALVPTSFPSDYLETNQGVFNLGNVESEDLVSLLDAGTGAASACFYEGTGDTVGGWEYTGQPGVVSLDLLFESDGSAATDVGLRLLYEAPADVVFFDEIVDEVIPDDVEITDRCTPIERSATVWASGIAQGE